MLNVNFFLVFFTIYMYLKYKISKHVKSLPKVDKSITFYYCTVIGDVLPLMTSFFEKTTQIVSDFLRVNFFKVGKFMIFSERPKAINVLATRGLCPLTPYYRGLTLVFEGLQLSNAGNGNKQLSKNSLYLTRHIICQFLMSAYYVLNDVAALLKTNLPKSLHITGTKCSFAQKVFVAIFKLNHQVSVLQALLAVNY